MTLKGLKNNLMNTLDVLVEDGIATQRTPAEERRAGSAVRLSWRSTGSGNPQLTDLTFGSMKEYKAILRHQMYSALLADGAILQLSYDFERHEIVGHRLVYYPCPFEIPPGLIDSEPILDLIEVIEDLQPETLRLRGPIRFDYSMSENPAYPRSHVHIASSNCRCPVVAPLMPGQFLRFVFRSFYPDLWLHKEYLRSLPRGLGNASIKTTDKPDLHFACSR